MRDKDKRNSFSFESERKQLMLICFLSVIFLFVIFIFLYLSSGRVNIYNVSNTMYVTAEKYVPDEEKININTADSDELQKINGVGEKTAQKILEYREDNGYFKSVYELTEISGISDATVDKIKPYIKIK